MPVADIAAARDSIYDHIENAWTAGASGAELQYADVRAALPASTASWGRVTVSHANGFQATLAGETGSRRFRAVGVVTVEIRTPWGQGNALTDVLVKLVAEALEDGPAAGGVEFNNVRAPEIGRDGDWTQVNVIADFEYDRIR